MPIWTPRISKPGPGAAIDWSRGLADGLGGFWAFGDGAGGVFHDATGRVPLAASGLGSSSPWGTGTQGPALSIGNASELASAILPPGLRPQYPLTIACGVRLPASPANSMTFMALTVNNTGTSPFAAAAIQYENAAGNFIQSGFQASGNAWTNGTHYDISGQGPDLVIALSLQPGHARLYTRGVRRIDDTPTLATALSYSATASIGVSCFPGFSTFAATGLTHWAGWWYRELDDSENRAIGGGVGSIWPLLYGSPTAYFLMSPAPAVPGANPAALLPAM